MIADVSLAPTLDSPARGTDLGSTRPRLRLIDGGRARVRTRRHPLDLGPFYGRPEVLRLSTLAFGLYGKVLLAMHRSESYGNLATDADDEARAIARQFGLETVDARVALAEIVDAGLLSRRAGALWSADLVAAEAVREARAATYRANGSRTAFRSRSEELANDPQGADNPGDSSGITVRDRTVRQIAATPDGNLPQPPENGADGKLPQAGTAICRTELERDEPAAVSTAESVVPSGLGSPVSHISELSLDTNPRDARAHTKGDGAENGAFPTLFPEATGPPPRSRRRVAIPDVAPVDFGSYEPLIARFLALYAARNSSGKITDGRVVSLRCELSTLRVELGDDRRFSYGLTAAVNANDGAGVPNVNYAAKAARGASFAPPPGQRPGSGVTLSDDRRRAYADAIAADALEFGEAPSC